jgi:orotidine-5'-phosphate decarboxylase
MPSSHLKTYAERAKNFANPSARRLLDTMERKKSNLAVSVDVIKASDFLAIIDAVGPYVCLIKATSVL